MLQVPFEQRPEQHSVFVVHAFPAVVQLPPPPPPSAPPVPPPIAAHFPPTHVSVQHAFPDAGHGSPSVTHCAALQEPFTHAPIPIPVPNISPLNPPLGVIPPIPLKFNIMKGTAKLSPIQAVLAGMAEASKTADAVTATGSLDVLRYGQILKARRLVGVRGSGPAFEGLYYVKSVTHKIKRGEFTQDFVLTRNGLLSTFPRVPA